jgi:hypothetical protein
VKVKGGAAGKKPLRRLEDKKEGLFFTPRNI